MNAPSLVAEPVAVSDSNMYPQQNPPSQSQRAHVLVAMPVSGGETEISSALSAAVRAAERTLVSIKPEGGSCLPHVFNRLWVEGLGRAGNPYTHFAMLHNDVEAAPNWVDTLIDEMDATGAVVMSAVVGIKDPKGVTSTGVGSPDDEYDYRRITATELHKLPETFGLSHIAMSGIWPAEYTAGKRLLVNTGCWITRLDWPGWHAKDADGFLKFFFEQRCRIQVWPDGHYCPEFSPEDWRMSRYVAREGGLVMATRKIRTVHYGKYGFASNSRWGAPTDVEIDGFNAQKRLAFAAAIQDEGGGEIGSSKTQKDPVEEASLCSV